ncbi:MAG TPA: hypothetical protein VNS58_09270 [Puia sp.]|nr:hypothetical protein [Puia sp.]
MTNQQPDVNTDQLAATLKQANKVIQSRFVFIALLVIVAACLLYSKIKPYREDKGSAIAQCLRTLRKMRDTSDLKGFIINNKWDVALVDEIVDGRLLYTLRKSNFEDRMPIIDALDKFAALRVSDPEPVDVFKQSTTIGGINIPIVSWLYFVPFILLVFFHDLVRIIEHRRIVLEKFKDARVEEWRQGPGLLGFQVYPGQDGILKITKMIDDLLSFILLLTPFLCSLILIKLISYFQAELWILVLEFACVIVIGIDLLILFKRENILRFSTFFDIYVGKKYFRAPGKRYIPMISWILVPVLVFSFLIVYTLSLPYWGKIKDYNYILLITSMSILLSASLFLGNLYPGNVLLKRVRFILIAVNLYWLAIILFVFYIHEPLNSLSNPNLTFGLSKISCFVSTGAFIATFYLWPVYRMKAPG